MHRLLVLFILFLSCWELSMAQTSETYAEEYALYQKAEAQADSAQKKAILLEFVKTYRKSDLDPNISTMYAQFYGGPRQRGEWQQLASLAEDFLRYRPSDIYAMAAASEAYQKLNSPQKLVEFATRLYSQNPNVGTAYAVAKAYQSMNDQANFLKWAGKTLQHDPGNLEMLIDSIAVHWQFQDLASAAADAKRGLKAIDAAQCPAGQTPEEWKTKSNQIRAYCYRALGEEAYRRNAFIEAQKSYQTSVKLDPKNDLAHYRLGFLLWQAGSIDAGLASFARATVLNGPTSSDARKQLNELYKQQHKNLVGIPRLIQAAKAELGIH